METEKPRMKGTWTLVAPDGRKWKAESPIKCCKLEQDERIPFKIRMERLMTFINDEVFVEDGTDEHF